MSYLEYAKELHKKGSNCCQSVLCSCCDRFDLTQETACRLGAFFSGGMHRGEVCGAVTGALMALGLAYGDDQRSRKSSEFLNAFKDTNGSILCRELVNAEGTKFGMCDRVIAYSIQYLDEEFGVTDRPLVSFEAAAAQPVKEAK